MPSNKEYLNVLASQQDLNWDGNYLPKEKEKEEDPLKKETTNYVRTTGINRPSN